MLAEKLFHSLERSGLKTAEGYINFDMLGVQTTIKTKSVVGDVIQDWLESYLKRHSVKYEIPSNSQQFPDFYLLNGNSRELLEVKCFDGDKSPNFDIANFTAYCQAILEKPERLDSYYLIFAYSMNTENYKISIKNFWLKHVWEISAPSEDWPVKFQIKRGMIYNIRPAAWYSDRSTYKPFQTRKDFVEALAKAIKLSPQTNHLHRANWLLNVTSGYKKATGKEL